MISWSNAARFNRGLLKSLSCFLTLLLLCGCATQPVRFTSNPTGASVTAGPVSGKTPCTLDVPDDCEEARFASPAGQTMAVEIPEPPSMLRVAVTECRYVGGDSCRFLSVPFLVVGVLGLAITRDGVDDWPREDDYQDDDIDLTIFAVGLVSLCIGGLFYLAGEAMTPDESAGRRVHANFPGARPLNVDDLQLHGHPKYTGGATNAPPDDPLDSHVPRFLPRMDPTPE